MLSLAKALRVERGDVIAFVGGGGKTTSMFRLAAELKAAGLRVVSTTTTHISKEQAGIAPAFIMLDEIAQLGARLDQHGHCLIIGPPDGKGRVFGASSELISSLKDRSDVDVVLVEADGSRSLPFKAPGRHEPVVPESTTILAPIAGLNSIGQPLDEAHVHRAELAAALARQPLGSAITPQTLARVLSHPDGGAKLRPAGARLVPILNKTDSDEALRQASEAAENMLAASTVDTVVLGSMREDPPVREAWMHTAGIVLAAGKSIRFGSTKRLLLWQDTSLAAHSVQTALDAGLDPVIAVLGHQSEQAAKALAGLPVQLVYNPDFAAGQNTSIRKGLEALPSYTGAAVFLLADQPLVCADIIKKIIAAHRRSLAPACAPMFEGRRGNPVLFDKMLFRELLELGGDTGGRELLGKYADATVMVSADRAVLLDIDTPEEYQKLNLLL